MKLRIWWLTFKLEILLTIIRQRKSIIMSVFWRILRSLLHQDQSTVDWHFILTDESSTTLLCQEDKNIDELQNILQKFSASDRETFVFVVTFLTIEICLAENDKSLFFYIRTVLEIFVLWRSVYCYVWSVKSTAKNQLLKPRAHFWRWEVDSSKMKQRSQNWSEESKMK